MYFIINLFRDINAPNIFLQNQLKLKRFNKYVCADIVQRHADKSLKARIRLGLV